MVLRHAGQPFPRKGAGIALVKASSAMIVSFATI
jgi:hypothetical protein